MIVYIGIVTTQHSSTDTCTLLFIFFPPARPLKKAITSFILFAAYLEVCTTIIFFLLLMNTNYFKVLRRQGWHNSFLCVVVELQEVISAIYRWKNKSWKRKITVLLFFSTVEELHCQFVFRIAQNLRVLFNIQRLSITAIFACMRSLHTALVCPGQCKFFIETLSINFTVGFGLPGKPNRWGLTHMR